MKKKITIVDFLLFTWREKEEALEKFDASLFISFQLK